MDTIARDAAINGNEYAINLALTAISLAGGAVTEYVRIDHGRTIDAVGADRLQAIAAMPKDRESRPARRAAIRAAAESLVP